MKSIVALISEIEELIPKDISGSETVISEADMNIVMTKGKKLLSMKDVYILFLKTKVYISAGSITLAVKESVSFSGLLLIDKEDFKKANGSQIEIEDGFVLNSYKKKLFEYDKNVAVEYFNVNIEELIIRKPKDSLKLTSEIKDVLDLALNNASKNNPKAELNGVFIGNMGGKKYIAATDAISLAVKEINEPISGNYIIPKVALNIALSQKPTDIYFSDNDSLFETSFGNLYIDNIQGNYPEFLRIVPQKTGLNIKEINFSELKELFTKNEAVSFLIKDGKLSLHGDDLSGWYSKYLIEKNENNTEVTLIHSRHLKKFKENKQSEIKIGFNKNERDRPVTFYFNDVAVIVMPIKLY